MKPGVLLVDDDADWLRICSQKLPQRDYTLKTSNSIESALRLLSAETFAVVVADICMPGASGLGGFEVLDRTKVLSPDTPVVMITAYTGGLKNITDEALARGAYSFVEKKRGFQELDNCITHAIDHWKWWREEREPFVGELEPPEPPTVEELEPPGAPIWTIEMQRESWQSQLAQHCWNLAKLEERAAEYGLLAVPLEVLSAIEKEKRAISELESKLRGLKGGNFQS